jgi:hypothetical protein
MESLRLYRFHALGFGLGIDVRAPSPALAWTRLRSRYPEVIVLDGPTPVATLQADPRTVRLSDVLGTDRT